MGPNYERDYMPDEDDAIVRYAPGDHPLCGNDSMNAVYTDDPAAVADCPDCLELAAEDLEEDKCGNDSDAVYTDDPAAVADCPDCLELAALHWANCLHCQQEISARNGVEWRRVVRAPCPHCGKAGW